jgi:hypothetical protein
MHILASDVFVLFVLFESQIFPMSSLYLAELDDVVVQFCDQGLTKFSLDVILFRLANFFLCSVADLHQKGEQHGIVGGGRDLAETVGRGLFRRWVTLKTIDERVKVSCARGEGRVG